MLVSELGVQGRGVISEDRSAFMEPLQKFTPFYTMC